MKKNKILNCLLVLVICLSTLMSCSSADSNKTSSNSNSETTTNKKAENNSTDNETSADFAGESFSLDNIPAFSNNAYVTVNNNKPFFTESDYTTESFEKYSELDSLGRCGVAYANVGKDLMPTEKRGAIGMVKPSGWHTVKYDNVDGKYLYNRCHLIGYQLTAENANEKNLITGTRYLNIEGMLPFENMVTDYVKETGNHVLYRVTPIYDGNNLVAKGVLMEGFSVEDKGEGICYNIFAYNSQPGINIDYATGDSSAADSNVSNKTTSTADTKHAVNSSDSSAADSSSNTADSTYILNTSSHKFHDPSCSGVTKMSEANKQEFNGSRDELINQGYEPCKICNP